MLENMEVTEPTKFNPDDGDILIFETRDPYAWTDEDLEDLKQDLVEFLDIPRDSVMVVAGLEPTVINPEEDDARD